MVAEDRLQKAKHCLDELRILLDKDKTGQLERPDLIRYELEDFLAAAKSLPDHILEDYNDKFKLGITLDDRLDLGLFKHKAQQLQNQGAISFAKWYENSLAILYQDPICLFLKSVRDVSIHRKEIKPVATRGISASIDVLIGNPEDFKDLKAETTPETNGPQTMTFGWFLPQYPDQDILSLCEHYFAKLKDFLEQARSNFS